MAALGDLFIPLHVRNQDKDTLIFILWKKLVESRDQLGIPANNSIMLLDPIRISSKEKSETEPS
jgi:hypothetical protein